MDIEIKIPDIGIDSAEVIDILVNVNDYIKKEQSLIVVEGDKTSMEIPSPCSGVIKEIKIKISDIIKTNTVIMLVNSNIESTKSDKNINRIIKNTNTENKNVVIYSSPIVRKIARSLNIDLKNILGTGRKNRITKQDIDNHIKNIDQTFDKNISNKNKISNHNNDINNQNVNFNRFGIVKIVQLNKIKKVSGDALFTNWSTIPHITQFDEVDITDLEQFRKKYNSELKNQKDKKITLLSFIVKVLYTGLKKFPYFNSSISKDNNTIFIKEYINIGIAVDTEYGLVVPVIKNIHQKTLSEIAKDILYFSKKARIGKLNITDVQGGSFTISSLGGIGGKFFTPIVNAPEAAILGVSKSFYKPIWNGEKFIPRLILPLSLSYNHRIIDGADGARFISFINKLLSDIRWLLC